MSMLMVGPSRPWRNEDTVKAVSLQRPMVAAMSALVAALVLSACGSSVTPTSTNASHATTTTRSPQSTTSGPPASTTVAQNCTSPGSAADRTQDITPAGSVSASSESAGYPATAAVDKNLTTSWFSTGTKDPNGDNSIFTWTATGATTKICSVSILDNSQNATPAFQTGYSFTSVTANLLGASGSVVATKDAAVAGQSITVAFPGPVLAARVQLVFHHHESPDCGGFSEFIARGFTS